MLRALLKRSVAEDLQVDKAGANGATPKNEEGCEEVEAEARAVAGCGGH